MFPTIEVFGFTIGMYGVMTVIGAALCVLLGLRLIKKFKIRWEDFVLVMITALIGIFIFAHILYGITNIETIAAAFAGIGKLTPDELFNMFLYSFGGMVFYGGFIGGALAILFYCRVINKKLNKNNLLDIYAVLVPLFHIFGRIGCFLGGCCYGIESEFGFTVNDNKLNPFINGVNRLPIQLIESGCNLLIFLFILYLFKKDFMKDRLIYIYMIIYPVVRFVLEFFRGDEYRGFLFGLSTSQWISIVLFVFAIVMLIVKRGQRNGTQNSIK